MPPWANVLASPYKRIKIKRKSANGELIPCKLIFLMALLPISQKYKQSWAEFHHRPNGEFILVCEPLPFTNPSTDPENVSVSKLKLEFLNHLFFL